MTTVIDNEALFRVCKKSLKVENPSYFDMNKLIANIISGVTCGLRYPGQLNGDLRKMALNLTPYPRMHFFSTSLAPLGKKEH